MATTATMPDCHTGPATAFFGDALQKMIIRAAAEIMTIWMTMFIFSALPSHDGRSDGTAANMTMTARASRKIYTARLASGGIFLSRVVAPPPKT